MVEAKKGKRNITSFFRCFAGVSLPASGLFQFSPMGLSPNHRVKGKSHRKEKCWNASKPQVWNRSTPHPVHGLFSISQPACQVAAIGRVSRCG